MKKLRLVVLVIAFFSCKKEEEEQLHDFLVGEWALVESTIPFDQTVYTGELLPFDESYIFREDGSFDKRRIEEGALTVATGSFRIEEAGNNQAGIRFNVFLDFGTGIELVGDCTHGNTETLVVLASNKLENTWHYCDGPRYVYDKVR
jgi:hypothetical protein